MTHHSNRPLAVVTGASSGIGYELAKQFAQNGFDLLITATSTKIDEVAQTLESMGSEVETVQADLTTYDGVETLYDKIKQTGTIEAIAINAGVGVGGDFAQDTDLAAELNVINLNVVSTVHLAKRVVKDMVQQGKGRILFTSSIASQAPQPFQAVYAASKAFIQSFSESTSYDHGIRVKACNFEPHGNIAFTLTRSIVSLHELSIKHEQNQIWGSKGFLQLLLSSFFCRTRFDDSKPF
ncbi:MAG: SDR family NAD(P)-dependent oxidoreductase [Leptolyngbya sp. Prado105]|nr:SDR family NAD(P)-dependent oxidoreductase [Leptolyngbya sp. Prado105]